MPTPVDCDVPQDCFGDALMILEFLNTFSKQVQLKDVFPHGFTFGEFHQIALNMLHFLNNLNKEKKNLGLKNLVLIVLFVYLSSFSPRSHSEGSN